jgi:hypothetical protein
MAGLFKPAGRVRPYRRAMFASLSLRSTGMAALDARDDFVRARRAQIAARALRWAGGRRHAPRHPRTLPASAARPSRAPRLEVIPLAAIVGTVDPSPHFDARFRPASGHLRARWERVALAHRRGLPLPPIEVRKGSDGYYVVDGRHRVSVALASGRREIDACVA